MQTPGEYIRSSKFCVFYASLCYHVMYKSKLHWKINTRKVLKVLELFVKVLGCENKQIDYFSCRTTGLKEDSID